MASLAALTVSDDPEVWRALGFAVDGDRCTIGRTVHHLGAAGKGLTGWALGGVALDADEVEGLPTVGAETATSLAPAHPNGVTGIDHIVVMTPDLERTIRTFEGLGLELRRIREAEAYGAPMRQAFFRLDEVILEVVGGPPATSDDPARFFGIAFNVADLDATASFLGARLHAAKDAVQPGRRIATLDRSAGSRVGMAFMSPGDAEYSG